MYIIWPLNNTPNVISTLLSLNLSQPYSPSRCYFKMLSVWHRPPNSSVLTKHLKGTGTRFDQGKRPKAENGERRRITSFWAPDGAKAKWRRGAPWRTPEIKGLNEKGEFIKRIKECLQDTAEPEEWTRSRVAVSSILHIYFLEALLNL